MRDEPGWSTCVADAEPAADEPEPSAGLAESGSPVVLRSEPILDSARPLTKPQSLADFRLGFARLAQGLELTAIFVCDPTIRPHS